MTIWVHRLFIHIFKAYNLSHFCSITKSKGFQLQPKLFFFVVIKSFSPFSKFFLHFEFFFLFFDFEIYFLTLKKIIYFEKVFFGMFRLPWKTNVLVSNFFFSVFD